MTMFHLEKTLSDMYILYHTHTHTHTCTCRVSEVHQVTKVYKVPRETLETEALLVVLGHLEMMESQYVHSQK